MPGALVFRPESSLLILNADYVLISVLERLAGAKDTSRGYCDLSASPMMDLAGAHMLAELAKKLDRRMNLTLTVAERNLYLTVGDDTLTCVVDRVPLV